MMMVCGPGFYTPTHSKKLAALQQYLELVEYLIPAEDSLTAPYLWHDDLHEENIFVDPLKPTEIVSIIDWQGVQAAPLFDHNLKPSFLGYDGPDMENLERPQLPANVEDLPEHEKAAAIKLYIDMSVAVGHRRLVQAKLPVLNAAIEFQNSDPFPLLHLSRRLFEYGEAHFQHLAANLKEIWADLPAVRCAGHPICPVHFSASHLECIEVDVEAADRGIEVMDSFKSRLGDRWPDKGVVPHNQYKSTKSLLQELKSEFIRKSARTVAEKELLNKLWPFDDVAT